MSVAITSLVAGLGRANSQDYVYAAFFLICTSTFLKIRWWLGAMALTAPLVAVHVLFSGPERRDMLPPEATVHMIVAWAVGSLTAYLSDWYRR